MTERVSGPLRFASGVAVAVLLAVSAACAHEAGPTHPMAVRTTRPASPEACVVWPRPQGMLGLPLVDARTQPIDPRVLGERLTWREAGHTITAWVGIDALDALDDLDFLPVRLADGPVHQWASTAYPTLFLAARRTGHPAPCDKVYVSTRGLPREAVDTVIAQLLVRRAPAGEVVPAPRPR